MNLSKEVLDKLDDYIDGKITIDGDLYHVKYACDCDQILANNIASKLGIIVPNDYYIKYGDKSYYLSYSFNNYGKFKTAKELGIKSDSLYDIWAFLEETYNKEEVKGLVYDLIKIFLFDIFTLSSDRNIGNYGILEINKEKHMVALDNEFIFSDYDIVLRPNLNYEDGLKKYTKLGNITDSIKTNMEVFEYFLACTSNEFYGLIEEFFYKLTPEVIEEEFNNIERIGLEIELKDYYLRLYKMNYECIEKILRERSIISNGVFKNK